MIEIIIHLLIGIFVWLGMVSFFLNKTAHLVFIIIAVQIIFALIHYPIAINSAEVLQQELTIGQYLWRIPIRIIISLIPGIILLRLSRPDKERPEIKKTSNIFRSLTAKIACLFTCPSQLFTRVGILFALLMSIISVTYIYDFEFSRALDKLDTAFSSKNHSSSIKIDYFWEGLFKVLGFTIIPALTAYLFVVQVIHRAFRWLKSGYESDLITKK